QRGDQVFYARDGDQVFCFFSIFAPNKFQDQVSVIWTRFDEARDEWVLREKAEVPLGTGGEMREAGWRTFRQKARYEPGEWRAGAWTSPGRVRWSAPASGAGRCAGRCTWWRPTTSPGCSRCSRPWPGPTRRGG